MPSHYSIIQYVPDPVANERINVGIAAYSDGAIKTYFLKNWQRVKSLCSKDALDLDRLESIFRGLDQPALEALIRQPVGSIQFSEPATSLQSIDEVLQSASDRFLVDPALPHRQHRSHSDVFAYARDTVKAAIRRRLNSRAAKAYVHTHMPIPGRFGIPRKFDLVIQNGRPIRAIQAISLASSKSIERRVEAVGFLAEEIRHSFPLTVVVAPPIGNDLIYANARHTFESVGAEVIDEDSFQDAADQIAQEVVASSQH